MICILKRRSDLPSFSPSLSPVLLPMSVSSGRELADIAVTLCRGSNISEENKGELEGESGDSQLNSDREAVEGAA